MWLTPNIVMDRAEVTILWPVSQFGLGSGSSVTTNQVELNEKVAWILGDDTIWVVGGGGNSHRDRPEEAIEMRASAHPLRSRSRTRSMFCSSYSRYSRSRSRGRSLSICEPRGITTAKMIFRAVVIRISVKATEILETIVVKWPGAVHIGQRVGLHTRFVFRMLVQSS